MCSGLGERVIFEPLEKKEMFMDVIVADIHNARLGSVFGVESLEKGKAIVKKLAENKLQRSLTDQENESLENEFEVYNDDDADNVWSYSIGLVEQNH